jgi:methyl-accepting chemotaxis protein
MERAKKSNHFIASISQEIQEQTTSVSGVKTSLEQISSIIQANSATSEESAASSQELSSQANMLKDLVSKFKTGEIVYTGSYDN